MGQRIGTRTNSGRIASLKINGHFASELLIHAHTAAYVNVPLVFVSGDEGICEDATLLIPPIATVAVKRGVGDASINIHPHLAVEQITERVQIALQGDISKCLLPLPENFAVEISFKEHAMALKASFFPGAELKQPHSIGFESDNYFDILRFFSFVL